MPETDAAFQNWISRCGRHLPAWIKRVARHIQAGGRSKSESIAAAINFAKHVCSSGDVANWPGPQNVNAASRAQACRAVAQWESLKRTCGRGRASADGEEFAMTMTDEEFAEALAEDIDLDAAELPEAWSGVLAPLGVASGDRRVLAAPAALRTRDLPLPLLWQEALSSGHGGAVVVGRIERVWMQGGMLMGEGTFDLDGENGREAARLVAEGLSNGISVDLDDLVMAEDASTEPPMVIATDWRLMTATLVSQPAFAEARIEPVWAEDEGDEYEDDDGDDEMAMRKRKKKRKRRRRSGYDAEATAAFAASSLPIADRDRPWDASAAQSRIIAKCGDDKSCWSQAYLIVADTPSASKFPVADVIGGQLTLIPRAVVAAAGRSGQATGVDQAALRRAICALYSKIRSRYDDFPECPVSTSASIDGALVADGAYKYPAQFFTDPKLPAPTPLSVSDDGYVFGHLAVWNSCHTGFAECIAPPKSTTNYSTFHVGTAITTDGEIHVGKITLGTGHADARAGIKATADHYDHTGTAVAIVRAGEDAFGIWVAGSLIRGTSDEAIEALRRSPLSGDWRRIDGKLELVAALAVNVPGFVVPRTIAASASWDEPTSLVAAGVITPPAPQPQPLVIAPEVAWAIVTELAPAIARELKNLEARALTASALNARIQNKGD